jgi:hypothetical protein
MKEITTIFFLKTDSTLLLLKSQVSLMDPVVKTFLTVLKIVFREWLWVLTKNVCFLINDQRDAQIFSMYLFLFLTLYKFGAHRAHHQDKQIVSICASHWSFTKNHYMMHVQQNTKVCAFWCQHAKVTVDSKMKFYLILYLFNNKVGLTKYPTDTYATFCVWNG